MNYNIYRISRNKWNKIVNNHSSQRHKPIVRKREEKARWERSYCKSNYGEQSEEEEEQKRKPKRKNKQNKQTKIEIICTSIQCVTDEARRSSAGMPQKLISSPSL